MSNLPDWPPELNISSFFPPPRTVWKSDEIEALQKISAVCRLFRKGLTPAAALNLARTLYASANLAGVTVSNWQTTLAFVGPSPDGEPPHADRLCPAVQLCLDSGKVQTCRSHNEDNLLNPCWRDLEDDETNLHSLVAIPLENEEEVIGVMEVYGSRLHPLSPVDIDLSRWVSTEASANLEIGRLRGSARQLAEAELKALRAQISPHFLFNTLNSIAALVRLDADQARELIVDFASFFRRTLKHHGEFVTLAEELDYVKHYVRFEQVRFGKHLEVEYDVAPGTEGVVLPVLTLQPLVENAINHGIAPKIGGGKVVIKTVAMDGDVLVSVSDNGLGIEPELLPRLFSEKTSKSKGLGMALPNIRERLQKIFGEDYQLKVESEPGKGTTVSFLVPRLRRG
ncbi:MAG TPA: histidine kinase [Chloroflexia bacterium]|nr:histidine kinase [Chloroflexia bacterium]